MNTNGPLEVIQQNSLGIERLKQADKQMDPCAGKPHPCSEKPKGVIFPMDLQRMMKPVKTHFTVNLEKLRSCLEKGNE